MIALIPARSGSTRLPSKNTRMFRGRPLLSWTLDAAKSAGVFHDVVVTSDDDECLRLAAGHGAITHRRPATLAESDTSMRETLMEAIISLGLTRSHDPICVLYPTYPLRTADDIRAIVDCWSERSSDTAIGTTAMLGIKRGGPVERAVRFEYGRGWAYMAPTATTYQTQQEGAAQTDEWCYCHFACVIRASAVTSATRQLFTERTAPFGIEHPERAFEVDTYSDFRLAEAIAGTTQPNRFGEGGADAEAIG